jgi:hypothetical protein
MRVGIRGFGILAAIVALGVFAAPASAVITPSGAPDIATAINGNANVTGASFVTVPPEGTPNAVSTTAFPGFPVVGSSYGILTSGDANLADDPNVAPNSGVDNGGDNVRGDTDFDVTILKVDLSVPQGDNCLSVDFRFLSEEFPEFVGSPFNDAFIAELETSNWSTSGSTISAPNNFAFDPNGEVVSVNSTGVANVTPEEAAGTTYDGATVPLRAQQVVSPGARSLFLTIFDQGDAIFDSAVFLDRLNLRSAPANQCVAGAALPEPEPEPEPEEEQNDPSVQIKNVPGACVSSNFRARVRIGDESKLKRVVAKLDGKRIDKTKKKQFSLSIPVRKLDRGKHTLKITAVDEFGNKSSKKKTFRVCAPAAPPFTG